MSHSRNMPNEDNSYLVLEGVAENPGTVSCPLDWPLFDDLFIMSPSASQEDVLGFGKHTGHPSSSAATKQNAIRKKPRISFNLKRYLKGIGCRYLLTLQKKRQEPLLLTAVREKHRDVVEVLLGRGGDPNVRGPGDRTPLHEAAARGHTHILELLLCHGAFVDAEDSAGETPLVAARLAGNYDAVVLLIAAGAGGYFQGEDIGDCGPQRGL